MVNNKSARIVPFYPPFEKEKNPYLILLIKSPSLEGLKNALVTGVTASQSGNRSASLILYLSTFKIDI